MAPLLLVLQIFTYSVWADEPKDQCFRLTKEHTYFADFIDEMSLHSKKKLGKWFTAVTFDNPDRKRALVVFNQEKEFIIPVEGYEEVLALSSDGARIVYGSRTKRNKGLLIRDLESGIFRRIEVPQDLLDVQFVGSDIEPTVMSLDRSRVKVQDAHGRDDYVDLSSAYWQGRLSKDGRHGVFYTQREKRIRVHDFQTKKDLHIQIPSSEYAHYLEDIVFSDDHQLAYLTITFFSDDQSRTKVFKIDLKKQTFEKKEFEGRGDTSVLTADGDFLFRSGLQTFSYSHDYYFKTGIEVDGALLAKSWWRENGKVHQPLSSPWKICFEKKYRVAAQGASCNDAAKTLPQPLEQMDYELKMSDWIDSELCSQPFDRELWDNVTPFPEGNEIDRAQAIWFLKRFQKKGGLSYQHLPILFSILKSNLLKDEPRLVSGTLAALVDFSPATYLDFVKKHPPISMVASHAPTCRASDEGMPVSNAKLKSLLDQMLRESEKETAIHQWQALAPLSNHLNQLTAEDQEKYIDEIAQRVADLAATDHNLRNVFPSKLYYFSVPAVKELFGHQVEPFTDLSVYEKNGLINPIILGTKKLKGADPHYLSEYGFSVTQPAVYPDDTELVDTIQWTHNAQEFRAPIYLQKTMKKPENYVPFAQSPDYPVLWSDNRLVGIVVPGKGISEDEMNGYWDYYIDQGFKFDESKPIQVKNVRHYLDLGIKHGLYDYLIKEAHSGGDDRNLFQFRTRGLAYVGTKTRSDGKKETIHLIYPVPSESKAHTGKTDYWSNSEFGQSVRNRELNGHGQLVYFNTSCNSEFKAAKEIRATQSKTLINIASRGGISIFDNDPESALYQLIHGFRQGKSYRELENPKSGEKFVFPIDRAAYSPVRHINSSIRWNYKILDKKGKLYQMGKTSDDVPDHIELRN